MIGLKLDTAKSMFFDSPKVVSAVDRAARRVLSRFGAYVRTAAQSSIRPRKKVSEPGSPPSSHNGLLRKFIYFGYDARQQSVVIGPVRLNSREGTAQDALEHGGTTRVATRRRGKRVTVAATVKARPFMQPALNQESPKMPDMWRDAIK